ncbi:hypothetical protein [Paenibacillus sp. J2TS4]|uniref:hypothetical protein n=1 Tax=Paenibacillus sp. J2TS4 TaxID=2807194 RepID=UPI001B1F5474|nr:hypothetical protein [Paenibacillus sp. J2TS4]GIP32703.1 hypothetical protein J2TS4_19130 [Paenibacillus sp. J2TS4]
MISMVKLEKHCAQFPCSRDVAAIDMQESMSVAEKPVNIAEDVQKCMSIAKKPVNIVEDMQKYMSFPTKTGKSVKSLNSNAYLLVLR